MLVTVQPESRRLPVEDALKRSEALFQAGKFSDADQACTEVLGTGLQDEEALTRRGNIALLRNQLAQAEGLLKRVTESDESTCTARRLLAEVYYRQDRFPQAAELFGTLGRAAMQKKLLALSAHQPYQLEGADQTLVSFVRIDPIPVVKVSINGNSPVNFVVDTGGAELAVDREYAEEGGLGEISEEPITEQLLLGHTTVDLVELGCIAVRNVPAHLLNIRKLSEPAFGELRIDGVIGTVFLYHFLATIDYPNEQLILRSRRKEVLRTFERSHEIDGAVVVPFWMAGDHFVVAWGALDDGKPMLFFVDTGLENGAFLTSRATAEELGISLDEERSIEETTIYGQMEQIPFDIGKLALGSAEQRDLVGLVGTLPVQDAFGFHIDGLISHQFFRNYAMTLDFTDMRIFLSRDAQTS